MVQLSKERINQILHEEGTKKEDSITILRSLYYRYMKLYEEYFKDFEALNQNKVEEFRNYNEETLSLIKYYYMDIPEDVAEALIEFDEKYNQNLLGANWREFLFKTYEEFKEEQEYKAGWGDAPSEKWLKQEFTRKALKDFYETMDYVFRDGFGNGSKTTENVIGSISGLFFGKKDK